MNIDSDGRGLVWTSGDRGPTDNKPTDYVDNMEYGVIMAIC
jgi:hypothetical protein